MLLTEKIAVITGGGRGIGRAIALKFAREGAAVVIAARTKSEIESVAQEVRAKGGTCVSHNRGCGRRKRLRAAHPASRRAIWPGGYSGEQRGRIRPRKTG